MQQERIILDTGRGNRGQQSFPAAAAGVITLRDSLGYLGFDPEKTKAVEAKLLAIKNK